MAGSRRVVSRGTMPRLVLAMLRRTPCVRTARKYKRGRRTVQQARVPQSRRQPMCLLTERLLTAMDNIRIRARKKATEPRPAPFQIRHARRGRRRTDAKQPSCSPVG